MAAKLFWILCFPGTLKLILERNLLFLKSLNYELKPENSIFLALILASDAVPYVL